MIAEKVGGTRLDGVALLDQAAALRVAPDLIVTGSPKLCRIPIRRRQSSAAFSTVIRPRRVWDGTAISTG